MAMQTTRRLDKIEQVIVREGAPKQINVRHLSGQEAEQAEREFILTQARAALGECEPSATVFVSTKVQRLREEMNFPRLTKEDAEQLIQEYDHAVE